MKKPGTFVATVLFSVISIIHLIRLIVGIEIIIGGWMVPAWVSYPGFAVTASLAVMLWRERTAG
jgi:hypothetical protein